LLVLSVSFAIWPVARLALGAGRTQRSPGAVELDTRSAYSHILVTRQGGVRTMLFVRDNGEKVEQSAVNLKKPYELLLPHSRFMFGSYLLRPKQERVLIVGLGGGAMVHFLAHYDPKLLVDAVEIDAAVVKIAEEYFDVRSGSNVRILTGDGLEYLKTTEFRYDVIYMDAYLKPAADTDPTGLPLKMKTEQFYKSLQARLTPEGVVVFNLNRHKDTEADVSAIQRVFPQAYMVRPPLGNLIVLASMATARELLPALYNRAKELDQRFKAGFSFQETLTRWAR
jgi:spermidine synthase